MRNAKIERKTSETDIFLELSLDGGVSEISTGVGFFDHMLTLFARHARYGLTLRCNGDTHIDGHHSVEDIGICLGTALNNALGDCAGIKRYGDIILPMDEALILAAVDISGRGLLVLDLDVDTDKVGDFDTELVEEFLLAFTRTAGITLHIKKLAGKNTHHIIEGCFKALARALAKATAVDAAANGEIPSTKGVLK